MQAKHFGMTLVPTPPLDGITGHVQWNLEKFIMEQNCFLKSDYFQSFPRSCLPIFPLSSVSSMSFPETKIYKLTFSNFILAFIGIFDWYKGV